jgi:hypothetical protein
LDATEAEMVAQREEIDRLKEQLDVLAQGATNMTPRRVRLLRGGQYVGAGWLRAPQGVSGLGDSAAVAADVVLDPLPGTRQIAVQSSPAQPVMSGASGSASSFVYSSATTVYPLVWPWAWGGLGASGPCPTNAPLPDPAEGTVFPDIPPPAPGTTPAPIMTRSSLQVPVRMGSWAGRQPRGIPGAGSPSVVATPRIAVSGGAVRTPAPARPTARVATAGPQRVATPIQNRPAAGAGGASVPGRMGR